MKFRFCGDGDCPDWVLAEIHSSLSILTSVKLKILTQMVIKSLLDDFVPEEKLKESFANYKNDLTPLKSAFACIRFLIISATRFNVDNTTFDAELQQLGLPKEHSGAICRVRAEHEDKLKNYLIETSLKVNELDSVTYTIPKETTLDCAQLTININNEIINGVPKNMQHKINISYRDVKMLLNELRTVDRLMTELNSENKLNDENINRRTSNGNGVNDENVITPTETTVTAPNNSISKLPETVLVGKQK